MDCGQIQSTSATQKQYQRTATECIQDAKQVVRQRIAQIVACEIMQMTEQERVQIIEDYINEGILEKPVTSYTCPECGTVFDPEEPFCPKCNWRQDKDEGEEEEKEEDSILEKDLLEKDDVPISEECKEIYSDMETEAGEHESLTSFLKGEGFTHEEADIGASLFLHTLGTVEKYDIDVIKQKGLNIIVNTQFINNKRDKVLQIWDKTLKINKLNEFIILYEEHVGAQNFYRAEEEPLISIIKIDNEFKVVVKNPLEDIIISNSSGRHLEEIYRTKIKITKNMYEETLPKIGKALLMKRRAFFEADSAETAWRILKTQPLTQTELANAAKLNKSTICRQIKHCAKLIGTPWGIIPLKNFIERHSTYNKEITTLELKEIIEDIVKKYRKEDKEVPASVIEEDLKKKGIDLKRRTVSYYLKKIKEIEK